MNDYPESEVEVQAPPEGKISIAINDVQENAL